MHCGRLRGQRGFDVHRFAGERNEKSKTRTGENERRRHPGLRTWLLRVADLATARLRRETKSAAPCLTPAAACAYETVRKPLVAVIPRGTQIVFPRPENINLASRVDPYRFCWIEGLVLLDQVETRLLIQILNELRASASLKERNPISYSKGRIYSRILIP